MKLFSARSVVPVTATYVCLGCGSVRKFIQGEKFPICDMCHAGTNEGPAGYTADSEFWMQLVA